MTSAKLRDLLLRRRLFRSRWVASSTSKNARRGTPIVLVSPLAVNMAIYDLFPNRSLVRYLRARGFEVYLVDWGRPRRRHDHHGIATYFAEYLPRVLAKVRAHSGSTRLSLHGWSFGGLFCLCYAALGTDPDIANLVLIASPFDYFKNGNLGQVYRRSKFIGSVAQSHDGRWGASGKPGCFPHERLVQ